MDATVLLSMCRRFFRLLARENSRPISLINVVTALSESFSPRLMTCATSSACRRLALKSLASQAGVALPSRSSGPTVRERETANRDQCRVFDQSARPDSMLLAPLRPSAARGSAFARSPGRNILDQRRLRALVSDGATNNSDLFDRMQRRKKCLTLRNSATIATAIGFPWSPPDEASTATTRAERRTAALCQAACPCGPPQDRLRRIRPTGRRVSVDGLAGLFGFSGRQVHLQLSTANDAGVVVIAHQRG